MTTRWHFSHVRQLPAQVLECWDRKRRDYVAVKIIRNIQVRMSGCVHGRCVCSCGMHEGSVCG